MTQHEIGTVDEFPEGKGAQVKVDGIEVAVFKVDDDEFYAVADSCPHKYMPFHVVGHDRYLSDFLIENGFYEEGCYEAIDGAADDMDVRGRLDMENGCVMCPAHQLEFDLETGENELTGWRIRTFDVTADDDGSVYLEI